MRNLGKFGERGAGYCGKQSQKSHFLRVAWMGERFQSSAVLGFVTPHIILTKSKPGKEHILASAPLRKYSHSFKPVRFPSVCDGASHLRHRFEELSQ